VSRDGEVEPVDPTWTGNFGSPALSPDGRRAVVAIQGETSMDLWVKQLDRGPSTRVTFEGSRNDYPTWTPDGASVSYTSNRIGPSFDLWTRRADASGEAVLNRDEEVALAEAAWSPDGEWFIYRTSTNTETAGDIRAFRRGGEAAAVTLAGTPFTEVQPAVSPDGRWMAYSSTENGRYEVFVVPFPDTGTAKWQVSVSGGVEPSWSRAGSELFYRNGRGELIAVSFQAESTFRVDAETVLFPISDYVGSIVRRQYDVTPDGQRFLFIRPLGGLERRLILVQNFSEELRARVR
jgi:serine/threonine-protein kinase